MKKPINKAALFLWVFAALLFLLDIPATLAIRQMIASARYPGGAALALAISWQNAWMYVRSAAISSLQLAAFGVLIELIDQIRWNALPIEMRSQAREHSLLWLVRNWPHSVDDQNSEGRG